MFQTCKSEGEKFAITQHCMYIARSFVTAFLVVGKKIGIGHIYTHIFYTYFLKRYQWISFFN